MNIKHPDLKISYNTSEDNLKKEFYFPCLKWADKFERGVGYFTSGWIEYNAEGMAEFISHGGKAKWITSPIMDKTDWEIIVKAAEDDREAYTEKLINLGIDRLKYELEENTRNLLAWMIHDELLEMRFAIPIMKLEDGDFHDKFGSFVRDGEEISFSGSINDSHKGFVNYEGIMVFAPWMGTAAYAGVIREKFKKLWEDRDANIKCYKMTDAVKNNIFQLRTKERPYHLTASVEPAAGKWRHQNEAMECFLRNKNGILEMATGTGKTHTAVMIMKYLFANKMINKAVICTYGNDLLEQWYHEVLLKFKGISLFRYYDTSYKELSQFLLCRKQSILILSLNAERISDSIKGMKKREKNAQESIFWIFDEIHRLGALSLRTELEGKIKPFGYRLGLSATPLREFDEKGNEFIRNEVGDVIFRFDLKAAIQRGILCEFDYIPLEYELTEKDRRKKRNIIASFEARKAGGEVISEEYMYRELARVNKLSQAKLPLFEQLIQQRRDLLEHCIIFVETMEYGELVQNILSKYIYRYHTYYAEDQKRELLRFGKGEIGCLVTCKKISEGIDIKSVKNIFLFSSDRSRLVTTQRIGRSLRINPEDLNKRANIIDFICRSSAEDERLLIEADKERKEWLEDLSRTRRVEG